MYRNLILAASIVLTLAACGKHEYPAAAVATFMNNCVQGGGSTKSCSCTLEKMQKKWSFDEFNKLGERAGAGDQDAASKIVEVAKSCK